VITDTGCPPPRWRIGIAGIAIECSVFSPHRSGLDDFTVRRDTALLARYGWIDENTPAGSDNSRATWSNEVEWVPLLQARALPGGPVHAETYHELKKEIVDRIRDAGDLDGVFLDIHGAMTVVGATDAEADLAQAVRSAVGPDALVSASMDLHGNVSRELAQAVDLITCYRMAPHEDAEESRERAARNLVTRLRCGGRPSKAWVQVPVLLPGEKTSTRIEPARGVYARVPDVEARPGVVDAAIWVGYAWGDEPRCRAAVVVTGDDETAIVDAARNLATDYWEAREAFSFVAPTGTLDACVAEAVSSSARPFVISDSGDNPTAGGAGDVSYGLARLLTVDALRTGESTAVYSAVMDPETVTTAVAAGLGAVVDVRVGGRIDATAQGPVAVTATVVGIQRDDAEGGDVVALRTGGLTFIVTTRRKQFDRIADWTAVNADPRAADLVIVKLGYLEPELYDIAADWRLALTPGGVDQDLPRLGHRAVRRPLFPFDAQPAVPDLTPELL